MRYTNADYQAIKKQLSQTTLCKGLGEGRQYASSVDELEKFNNCSVAAINLALFGCLTDTVPECMSNLIGIWIISVQDQLPFAVLNSDEWRDLLPMAAGTGRDHENAIAAILLQHVKDTLTRADISDSEVAGLLREAVAKDDPAEMRMLAQFHLQHTYYRGVLQSLAEYLVVRDMDPSAAYAYLAQASMQALKANNNDIQDTEAVLDLLSKMIAEGWEVSDESLDDILKQEVADRKRERRASLGLITAENEEDNDKEEE